MNHVQVFGCTAYVYSNHPKSNHHGGGFRGIHLRGNENGAYIVEGLSGKKILHSVPVTFAEFSFLE